MRDRTHDRCPVKGLKVFAGVRNDFSRHSRQITAGIQCLGPAELFECRGMVGEGQQPESLEDRVVKLERINMNMLLVDPDTRLSRNERAEAQFPDQEHVERTDIHFVKLASAGSSLGNIPYGAADPVPAEIKIERREQRAEQNSYRFVRPDRRNSLPIGSNAEEAQGLYFQWGVRDIHATLTEQTELVKNGNAHACYVEVVRN